MIFILHPLNLIHTYYDLRTNPHTSLISLSTTYYKIQLPLFSFYTSQYAPITVTLPEDLRPKVSIVHNRS